MNDVIGIVTRNIFTKINLAINISSTWNLEKLQQKTWHKTITKIKNCIAVKLQKESRDEPTSSILQ